MTATILKAASIITMDDANPRAEAIAFDDATGKILAVGTVAQCQAAAPGTDVTDLGATVLMPGFIEAHSHPHAGRDDHPDAVLLDRAIHGLSALQ